MLTTNLTLATLLLDRQNYTRFRVQIGAKLATIYILTRFTGTYIHRAAR